MYKSLKYTKCFWITRLKYEIQKVIQLIWFSKLFREMCNYTLILVGIIPYLLSLEGCSDEENACMNTVFSAEKITLFMVYVFISALFFTLNIWAAFSNYIKKKSILIELVVIAFLCLIYDTGDGVKKHGAYNRIILIVAILIFIIIFGLLTMLWKLGKKFNIELAFSHFILIFLIISMFLFNYVMDGSCDHWSKGFKNTIIENSYPCKINPPNYCVEKVVNGWFDISKMLGDTCENMGNNKKSLIEKYTKLQNPSIIGYPRVENWDFGHDSLFANYNEEVIKRIIDMNNDTESKIIKNQIEITVNFEKTPPKVLINITRNEDIIKERKPLYEKNKKDIIPRNVLVMFIDSVSRNNVKIKLPRLYKLIEELYESDDSSPYESFQFLKYHALGPTTNPNNFPAFAGVPYTASKGDHVTKYYKEKGFITGNAYNECVREFVNLHGDFNKDFGWIASDHEFSQFMCDPNFVKPDDRSAIFDGPYSPRISCLYDNPTFSYITNYTTQFWEKYLDQPKFFRMGNINAHDQTNEVIKYDEDIFIDFLNNFFKNKYLENTALIIFSDHDASQPYLRNSDHMYEIYLPAMFMILPKKMKNFEQIKKNLRYYENRLITPYDIHKTILGFINMDSELNNLGRNLVGNETEDFNCNHFNINILNCRCAA